MPSVIADVISTDKRNIYLSRLDGIVSISFIVGPALGGILSQVSNQFPLYVLYLTSILTNSYAAGVVSGLALIVALIFLKESNPLIIDENGNRREKKLVKGMTFVLPENK